MRSRSRFAAFSLLALGLAAPGLAEIYHWTDAQGNVHFTQDLTQVPARERAAAESSARKETKHAQPIGAASAAALVSATPRVSGSSHGVQIPFEKQGNSMIVYARINDRVTAPFIVDTGASDVLIPDHVAQAAGISIGRGTPQATYQTANGLVEKPIVVIDAVQLGDARVENLRGSVSGSMPVGLLGGTFFNNFTFQIDPAANMITLFPNARVRGGANAAEWRARFRALEDDLAAVDAFLADGQLLDERRAASLAERRAALAAELEALEEEANLLGVPQAWRED